MPPSPAEWAIIHRYSHRVRELTIDVSAGRFTMFFLRITSLHPSVLVPNLRVLKWDPCVFPQSQRGLPIIFILRLLSPSLVSLRVTLGDPDDVSLHSFLANYPFLCPNLKFIDIGTGGHEKISSTTIKVLSRAITHHKHLERLTVYVPIDDVALTHIATSLQVKTLSLVLHPLRSNLHQIRFPSHITPFYTVKELTLQVWNVSHVTTLLRAQDQVFRSFWLSHRSPLTPEAISVLFTALVSPHRVCSLRSLTLIHDPFDVESRRFVPEDFDELTMRHHLSYDTLRPLSSLCHLRKLDINIGQWISIGDDDLISLTRNWRSLHILRVDCGQYVDDHPWRSAKYITFKGLLSLLECCPDIHEISFPLDARVVPGDTGDIVCNPALTCLRFPASPISHARSVANFLKRHFPTVTEVTTSFTLLPEEEDVEIELYNVLWDKVDSYINYTEVDDDGLDS